MSCLETVDRLSAGTVLAHTITFTLTAYWSWILK